MTMSRILLVLAAVACVFATLGECHGAAHERKLHLAPPVAQYQHCGTDLSGSFGCCKAGLICAYSNPWWSMCVTPAECPNQGGYTCGFDACGKPVTTTTPPPPATVPRQYQHCGNDVTGSYGCCASGQICAFGNAWWSMCVTVAECPKQIGYQCNRNACGKTV